MPSGPTGRRREGPDEGWVRKATTPPGGARWNRNNAHNCTPATPCLKPVRQPADCGHSQWLPGPCSLGLQPLRRTRCSGQVGPVPARLHDSPRLLHASTRSGNWPDQLASICRAWPPRRPNASYQPAAGLVDRGGQPLEALAMTTAVLISTGVELADLSEPTGSPTKLTNRSGTPPLPPAKRRRRTPPTRPLSQSRSSDARRRIERFLTALLPAARAASRRPEPVSEINVAQPGRSQSSTTLREVLLPPTSWSAGTRRADQRLSHRVDRPRRRRRQRHRSSRRTGPSSGWPSPGTNSFQRRLPAPLRPSRARARRGRGQGVELVNPVGESTRPLTVAKQGEHRNALTCAFEPEAGFEPTTFRLRAGCSASA